MGVASIENGRGRKHFRAHSARLYKLPPQPSTSSYAYGNISVVIGQTTGEWFISASKLSRLLICMTGVFLSLNGTTIPNDGYVLVNSISIHDSGLHCNTDKYDCCRGSDNSNGVASSGAVVPP